MGSVLGDVAADHLRLLPMVGKIGAVQGAATARFARSWLDVALGKDPRAASQGIPANPAQGVIFSPGDTYFQVRALDFSLVFQ